MDRLARISSDALEHDKISLLKKMYYDKYVIKPENIPKSYFDHQEQIALDRGYGHVHYDERTKKEEVNSIINEQKESLDSWLDYFSSSDTEIYPTWFKYFCFQGMFKIGYLDKKNHEFTKRTSSTVKPFIELNREAIALIYDELLKLFNKEELKDKKMKNLLDGGGFSKIYAYAIRKIDSSKKSNIDSDDGIWKKYPQGSNPEILFNDIHGKGTGWCTAGGIETARMHINGGDFYVYYTKDETNSFTNPRIAIRTENGKIAEMVGDDIDTAWSGYTFRQKEGCINYLKRNNFRAEVIKAPNIIKLSRTEYLKQEISKLHVGEIYDAYIYSISKFGLFCKIKGDITVRIHKTRLSTLRIYEPEKFFKVGEKIEIQIYSVQREAPFFVEGTRIIPDEKPPVKEGDLVKVKMGNTANEEGVYCEITPSTSGIVDMNCRNINPKKYLGKEAIVQIKSIKMNTTIKKYTCRARIIQMTK